jgi:PAS domain S-box-containing protein
MEYSFDSLSNAGFMPHGHCYYWEPYILWSHALSDGVIALAYMAIPFTLFYIFRKRKDFRFVRIMLLFALFIFGCGITHVFDVVTIWNPVYRADSVARIVTALASIATAVVLVKITPDIVRIPTPWQWKKVNAELAAANQELSAANQELSLLNEQLTAANTAIRQLSEEKIRHSQERYQLLADSITDIFFALDHQFRFTYWNKASEITSGLPAAQALGKRMYELYPKLKDTPLDQLYQQVMSSGKAGKLTYALELKGQVRHFEVNAYPTPDGISVLTVDITPLQQATQQLQAQQEQLELVLRSAGLGTWERDIRRQHTRVDERLATLLGYDRHADLQARIDERGWLALIHPDDVPAVTEAFDQYLAGQREHYQTQYRLKNQAGDWKWVMSSGKLVERDAQGSPLRMVGVLQDISGIKRAEESLRFYKYLIDHTHDPIYWIDPANDFRFSFVNRAACQHFNLPEETLYQMSIPDWDPTFTIADCRAFWEQLRTEQSLTFETVHRDALGTRIPVEVSATLLHYQGREYFAGYFRNITERLASSNKIVELQQRLEGIIASAMDAIITTDETMHIRMVNQAAEQLFGYPSTQLLDHSLTKLIPQRYLTAHQQHVERFSRSGKTTRKMGSNMAIYGLKADGQEFPLEASISQVVVQEKKYFTVIMRDISSRLAAEQQEKALQTELLRQNEQLQQFTYILSHNIRGPVATVLGLIELFNEDDPTDELNQIAIDNLRLTAQKMDEVIRDLSLILEYQKDIATRREWVTISDRIVNARVMLASAIEDSDAQLSLDLQVDQVYTVKSYLDSILYNLMLNAIKYRHAQRRPVVQLISRQEKDSICLQVVDNGIGIDLAKYQSNLFGMYQRFHRHVEGKGIGLHLVKTQVETLGGTIEVSSVVDQGTTFTVYLPLNNG